VLMASLHYSSHGVYGCFSWRSKATSRQVRC